MPRPDLQTLPAAESLYQELLVYSEQVKSLRGTARIRIRVLEKKVRLDAVIICDRKGRLRLEVLDFLDHVIFLVLMRNDRFLIYSVPENQYMEEPADSEQFRKTLGIPLSGKDLIALLLGSPVFSPITSPRVGIVSTEEAIMLRAEQASEGRSYMIWLDGLRRPWRTILVREQGEGQAPVVVQADFSDYREGASPAFPWSIRVSEAASQEFLEMEYESVVLNQPVEEDLFDFDPPEDAERIKW